MLRDPADFRTRIYSTYRATTAANPAAGSAAPLPTMLRQYRQRWSQHLPSDRSARFLDIGCGGGEFLLFLRQQGYGNAEGIDLSPEQVQLARSRGLEHVEVAEALAYLTDRRSAYSVINLQNVLEHFARPELFGLLDSVVQALESGGRVFGVVPNSKSLLGARVRYADLTHELSFTPESLRQLGAVVGLRILTVREQGPLVHGPASALRWTVWQVVRLGLWAALLAEGADYSDRVYTQDMLFVAEKT